MVTTPNAEYNVRWDALPAGRFRHPDHRFEWSRADFAGWARQVADRYGYLVRLLPVGPVDPELGPPTQLAVFTRAPAGAEPGDTDLAGADLAGADPTSTDPTSAEHVTTDLAGADQATTHQTTIHQASTDPGAAR